MSILKFIAKAFLLFFIFIGAMIAVIGLKCPDCVTFSAKLGPIEASTRNAPYQSINFDGTRATGQHKITNFGLTKTGRVNLDRDTARSSNRYQQGETIFFVGTPSGFGWSLVDGQPTISMALLLEVKDASGRVVTQGELGRVNIPSDSTRNDLFLHASFETTRLAPGRYDMTVTYRELMGKRYVKVPMTIEVVAAGADA
ncbi:MAG: hypothetical protein ACT4N2_05185 [Hyphomicrobium sp.]